MIRVANSHLKLYSHCHLSNYSPVQIVKSTIYYSKLMEKLTECNFLFKVKKNPDKFLRKIAEYFLVL